VFTYLCCVGGFCVVLWCGAVHMALFLVCLGDPGIGMTLLKSVI
jgi:hypothetical protein